MTSVSELVPTASSLDRGVLPTTEVIARVMRIQEIMAKVMKEDVHYGKIPGTPKPTLLKPGAELLLMTFKIAAKPSNVEELSIPGEEIRYRTTVQATTQGAGEFLGEMIGECSSSEEKYKWRKPVCDEEWQETDPAHRREKWSRGDKGAYKVKQVRTQPADVANTILKMAVKRGLIAVTLSVLAASDIFAQDVEDLAEELREAIGGEAPKETKQPQRKSHTAAQAGEKPAAKTETKAAAETVVGVLEKLWRPKGKDLFAVKVKGDPRVFTQWIKNHEQLEQDLKQFDGTERSVKLAYTVATKGDQTYYNVTGVAIADAELPQTPAPTTQPQEPQKAATDEGPPITAADIFDHARREPGAEG